MNSSFTEFWGKARAHENSAAAMHPIVAHALDVAAVAMLLPKVGLNLDGRSLGWLVFLHDIGKFSRPFQAMAPEHWPARCLGAFDGAPPGPKHDALALSLLQDTAADLVAPILPLQQGNSRAWIPSYRAKLFRAIAGHHGRPVTKPEFGSGVLGPECEGAARRFLAAMSDVFRPPPIPVPPDARTLTALEWHLAGLVTLADWVGSRQAWFPYVTVDAVADPAAYFWTHALPRAAAALSAAGLVGTSAAPFDGLRRLFPAVTTPSPVQIWAEQIDLLHDLGRHEHAPLASNPCARSPRRCRLPRSPHRSQCRSTRRLWRPRLPRRPASRRRCWRCSSARRVRRLRDDGRDGLDVALSPRPTQRRHQAQAGPGAHQQRCA